MKTCWIVQDYRKPVHVFELEEDARSYAEMAGTEDLYEAVYVDEDVEEKYKRLVGELKKAAGRGTADVLDRQHAGLDRMLEAVLADD